MTAGGLSAAGYARALERRWSDLVGRPVVLSPRDWARVRRWHAAGIPLEVVFEAMDAAVERSRGAEPFRSLSALGAMVEESWAVIVDGRLVDPASGEDGAPDRSWRERIAAEPPDSRIASTLRRFQDRLDGGESAHVLDEELDAHLPELAGPDVLAEVRGEVAEDLRPFRARMSADRYERTLRRAVVERLRRHLGLPRLTADRAAH